MEENTDPIPRSERGPCDADPEAPPDAAERAMDHAAQDEPKGRIRSHKGSNANDMGRVLGGDRGYAGISAGDVESGVSGNSAETGTDEPVK